MINVIIGIIIGLIIGIVITSLLKISSINSLLEEIERIKQNKNWISWLEGVHYERDYWRFKIKEKIEKLENQKDLYFEKQVIQGKIDLLNEITKE